ncbi:MAG: DUF58 domain-containing protein, partial [Chloroflexi bacterium]
MESPTRSGRFILLAALAYALILAGVVTLNGGPLTLAVPLVVYLFATLVHRAPQIKVSAIRSINAEVLPQGEPLEVTVRITNEGQDLEEVMIEDPLPRGLSVERGQTRLLTSLPHGASYQMKYIVRGPRGSFSFNEIRVSASDHLGVLRDQAVVPARGRIVYLPEVTRLRKVAIRPQRTHGHFGPIPSRQAGLGVDFYGLREYQMGDPRRWINWRASARHNQEIFVNQFEQERIADVGIILDARQQSNVLLPGDKSLFEYSVQATGSLSEALVNDGNRVALLIYGYGMERTFRGYGKVQQERILYALGQARTGHNFALESLGFLPTRFFPAGSQIVMVSPLMNGDIQALSQLRSCGYDLLVVSPDPVDFESRELGIQGSIAWELAHLERTLLLRKL